MLKHGDIVEAKMKEAQFNLLSLLIISTITFFVLAISSDSLFEQKLLVSYGLILDVMGVLLVSYTILFSRPIKTAQSTMFLSNHPSYAPQAEYQYAQKHALKAKLGIVLLMFGFFIQFLSQWI